jgi:DNA polymerase III epsilon subunit family exonuclease
VSARARFAIWLALLTLLVYACVGAFVMAAWLSLGSDGQVQLRALMVTAAVPLVAVALLLPVLLGGLLRWWIAAYPGAAVRMAEEVALIHTVNPAHRVTLAGGSEMRLLGLAINALAEAHTRLDSQVQARVDDAHQRLAEEKNRLAALMSELVNSVLVCNAEGRIVLYNPRAAQLLEEATPDAAAAGGGPLGLGRSIFGILERSQVMHALDRIGQRLEQGIDRPVVHFVTARGDQLLRVRMAPVPDARGEIGGFVLVLEDITDAMAADARRERLMRQLTEGTGSSLANLRAAIETVAQQPDMDTAQRERLLVAMRDEVAALSARLDDASAADADALGSVWPVEDMLATPASTAGRPVYYDFDLFSTRQQAPELDDCPLAELSYTVFDTETTGLSPSDGDELIAVGAVRIVNGRLLRQECFDRLIKPDRPVRPESQAIHGITPEMLAGQPAIERVLPPFARFAEDTVLVAHNAAFDMRFLQLAEARTGVAFTQPVLDTLMLSALAHPGHPEAEHRLERIAARLGVEVIGRHTALGDAIVTGEVFLRLLPLLAEKGIHTLRQAREASQKSRYAKLEY